MQLNTSKVFGNESWLVLTNVLLGAFVITCLILILASAFHDIIRRRLKRAPAAGLNSDTRLTLPPEREGKLRSTAD